MSKTAAVAAAPVKKKSAEDCVKKWYRITMCMDKKDCHTIISFWRTCVA